MEQCNIQEQEVGFIYRTAVGELTYALVVVRMEISFAITKLSQYSSNPALLHYQALKNVFAYLNNTLEDGLIFWRKRPRMDLVPNIPPPRIRTNVIDRLPSPQVTANKILAYCDSDWGSDTSHRRSVSGMIILLSGAAVIYKTRYQKTIAMSSTEAGFVSASETGKMILYLRSLLHDLGHTPTNPTHLNIDNTGTTFMTAAQPGSHQPNKLATLTFGILRFSIGQQQNIFSPLPSRPNSTSATP